MISAQTEIILFWVAVFAYAGAFALYLFGFMRRRDKGMELAFKLLPVGLLFHTLAIAIRWLDAGHIPVTDTYELNLVGSWLAMALYLLLVWIGRADRSLHLVSTPVLFVVMGYGYMARTAVSPMGEAYDSPWLVLHVVFAFLAFGSFLTACSASILFLVKESKGEAGRLARVPALADLDTMSYRYIVLGFINHAVMLVAGSIWAKNLWGAYWNWDPLETWSLITFVFYAPHPHLRSFMGWKMRRAAWLAVVGLIIVAISFWGVNLFAPSVHPGI